MAELPVRQDNKCDRCTGSTCCTYITHEIDSPRSMNDFDHLLWQISHRSVSVFKDSEGWFLLVENTCGHLQPDGGCGIYEIRPTVCRAHSNDWCELDEPREASFEWHYRDFGELDAYCRKRFKTWDKRHQNGSK